MVPIAAPILLLITQIHEGDQIHFRGRYITYKSSDQVIELDCPKLDPRLETCYLAQAYLEGSTATSLYVWQIASYPTLTNEYGRYFSCTIYYAEFDHKDTKETLKRVGDLAFWGTRKRVGNTIQFQVYKLYGSMNPTSTHTFQLKVFPGFPNFDQAP